MTQAPLLVLVAGPYRSGTNGEQSLIDANLQRLEAAALAVYQKGHLPVISEWLSLPLAHTAGSKALGDDISESLLYPLAHRLIGRCDAILRIPGQSAGADMDIQVATAHGLRIYYSLDDLPKV